MERYSRHIILPEIGAEGQYRLAHGQVLIIGAGGLGCPVAIYLAAAGVGTLGLCDDDTVSLSNLQRQILYREADCGAPKIRCAAEQLKALRTDLRCDLHHERLTAENAGSIIGEYDVVVDCCDNFATRYLIDEVCRSLGKPWIHGAIGAFFGRVTTFLPDSPHRFTDLYPEQEELTCKTPAAGGVLGAVPGAVGSIQACEALKLLGNFGEPLSGKLLAIDFLNNLYNVIEY